MLVDGRTIGIRPAALERKNFRFGRLEDRLACVVHFLHHLALVFADLVFDTSDGNAVLIHRRALDGDSIVFPWQDLSIWMQLQHGRKPLFNAGLQIKAKAVELLTKTRSLGA